MATNQNNETALLNSLRGGSIDFAIDVMVNNTGFTSRSELFGPFAAYGDNFTSPIRLNFTNSIIGLEQQLDLPS